MKRAIFSKKAYIQVVSLPLLLLFLFSALVAIFLAIGFWPKSSFSQTELSRFPADNNNLFIMHGESKVRPWSGWWWPFYVKLPPNLYNPQGPMDKYDQVSIARNHKNPETMAWERKHHFTDKKDEDWFGHCNGWAAAAVLEAKPVAPREISGIKFSVNDIKGLLSEWNWWDPATAFYGSRYDDENDDMNDVYPDEFHRVIIDFIGVRGLPLIMDISGGTKEKGDPQVWNFPAYRYEFEYRTDQNNNEIIHVHCRLWFSDSTPSGSTDERSFVMNYFYWIKGERNEPTSGEWETAQEGGWKLKGDSRKDHPDFIWYPVRANEHPVLDRQQLFEIVGQGER